MQAKRDGCVSWVVQEVHSKTELGVLFAPAEGAPTAHPYAPPLPRMHGPSSVTLALGCGSPAKGWREENKIREFVPGSLLSPTPERFLGTCSVQFSLLLVSCDPAPVLSPLWACSGHSPGASGPGCCTSGWLPQHPAHRLWI